MLTFLKPLWYLLVGFALLLFSTIFYPAIQAGIVQLKSDTAGISGNYWGLTNTWDSTRLIIFVAGLIMILIKVISVWTHNRKQY